MKLFETSQLPSSFQFRDSIFAFEELNGSFFEFYQSIITRPWKHCRVFFAIREPYPVASLILDHRSGQVDRFRLYQVSLISEESIDQIVSPIMETAHS